MTREIKFRAWNKANKVMHLDLDPTSSPQYTSLNLYLDRIQTACVVMQYTGLKDKNGKEIYEGDLVFDEDGEYSKTCIIEWSNDNAKFFGISVFDDEVYDMDEICGEVIGNIYENPELL